LSAAAPGRSKPTPAAGEDRAGPVPAPGAAISNLKEVRKPGGGASGLGALGFLAARSGARDWSRLLLVSNHHVLFAHGAQPGDPVYQPRFDLVGDRFDLVGDRIAFEENPEAIATLASGGHEGNWRYAYPGEKEKEWFVDCAAAGLTDCGAVPDRGPVLFASVARATAQDARAGQGLRVSKLGRDTAPCGRIVGVDVTVSLGDGSPRHNNIVIRALPGPDGAVRAFAYEGDSGALVVDRLGRAVGLLWGVSLARPDEAYASHIHPVLDCLKLVPYRRALADGRGGRDGTG